MICPTCGSEMTQTRRGATLRRRGPAYVCPQSRADFPKDAEGRFYRREGAVHPYVRVWSLEELEAQERTGAGRW
jgi:hypothetical protein